MCVQWFTVCVLHETESPTMVVLKSDLLSFPSQGQPQSLTHKRQKRNVPNEWQFKREINNIILDVSPKYKTNIQGFT